MAERIIEKLSRVSPATVGKQKRKKRVEKHQHEGRFNVKMEGESKMRQDKNE